MPPTLLLQRLANPNLPYQPNARAGYNPYVTVDYVDMKQVGTATGETVVNDAREFNANGTNWPATSHGPNNRFPSAATSPMRRSAARPALAAAAGAGTRQRHRQPADDDLLQPSTRPRPRPTHWLVHLDRPLISPVELLNVSAFKPHELTQQFIERERYAHGLTGHVAPWTDQNRPRCCTGCWSS